MIDHTGVVVSDFAKSRAFYVSALTPIGYQLLWAPGARPHYHTNYYGAFVLDLDGHNIEAVCHDPA